MLIFFIVFCYSSYIGLVCVWLLLGAIINPNNFLVYSTAALTFLTFLSSKYQAFQKISDDGFKMIKDQVFKIIQGQIKSIMGFMIEEVKELTIIGKDLMNSDTAKFAFEKAEALGLGEEIAAIKNLTEKTLDNPDKLVNSAVNLAGSFIENPNTMIEKLKNAEEILKEKAVMLFKTKCKSYNIPEELVEIFLSFNFKDEEKLKISLAELFENKSEAILGEKINKQLIKSIMDLVIHPKNIKDPSELSRIVTQELVANIVELFIVRAIKADTSQDLTGSLAKIKDYREVCLRSFSMISSLKCKNSKVCLQEMRKLMKLLSANSAESKKMTGILELVDILMTMKNESQYKQRILQYLNENIADPDLFDFFSTIIFSAPDEQILDIGKKNYIKSDHIRPLIEKILKEKCSFPNILNPKLIASTASFAIKSLKNQLENSDIEETGEIFAKFLSEILVKEGLKSPNKKDLTKILQILPGFFHFGKNPVSYWTELSRKYDLDITSIKEIITLMTENYWQHFFPNRMDSLSESRIILIISSKLKMNREELLGFIAIFFEEYEQCYVEDFLNSLIEYEKSSFPQKFRVFIKEIVKILFSNYKGFYINVQLAEMGIGAEKRFSFLKDHCLIDSVTKSLMKFECETPEPTIKKDFEDKFIEDLLILISESTKEPEILVKMAKLKEFLQRLKSLFSLKKIAKNNVRRNIEIKNIVANFAEKYKYDNEGVELLLFILMGDYQHAIDGFGYFLKENTLDFPYKESSYKQIIRGIIVEDRMMSGSGLMKLVDKWIPETEDFVTDENDRDFLAKSFAPILWYGADATEFVKKLALMSGNNDRTEGNLKKKTSLDGNSKEKKEENLKKKASLDRNKEKNEENMKKLKEKSFAFFHLSELETLNVDISFLFPIVSDARSGDAILEINYTDKEETFAENSNPRDLLNLAEPVLKEEISLEKVKAFQNKFSLFSELTLSPNVGYDEIFELFFENSEKKENIDWNSLEEVKKYLILFSFINNKVHVDLGDKKINITVLWKQADNKLILKQRVFYEISEFFKEKLSLNPKEKLDFNEFNRVLKYFFTTDNEVFARGIIQNFNEFHGKLPDLIDILSICSKKPSVESLSNILSVNSGEIETILNICRFFYAKSSKEKYEILVNFSKLFKKLSIDLNEFLLLLKFLHNQLDPFVFPKFISTFALDKHVNNKLLQSIFALFSKYEENSGNDEKYEICAKLSKDRSEVFKAIGINCSFGDLLCDITEGNFWNLKNIIQGNTMLSQIKIFPKKNNKNLVETISAFIGFIANNTKINMKIEDLCMKFAAKTMKLGNNQETTAFLLFDHFQISPIFTFLGFDDKNTWNLCGKLNKKLAGKIKILLKAFDLMSLKEKNRLVELEFLMSIQDLQGDEDTYEDEDEEKKKKRHFYQEVCGRKRGGSRKASSRASNADLSKNKEKNVKIEEIPEENEKIEGKDDNEKIEEKEDKEKSEKSEKMEKMEKSEKSSEAEKISADSLEEPKIKDMFDFEDVFTEMSQILQKNLKSVCKQEQIKPDDSLYMAFPEDSSKYELWDVIFQVQSLYRDANSLGVPTNINDDFQDFSNIFTKLVMISLLKSLRGLFSKKNEEKPEEKKNEEKKNDEKKTEEKKTEEKGKKTTKKKTKAEILEETRKEKKFKEDQYKDMIKFGLNFDLLLVSMEKLKFLNDEYETFKNFDKNALLKFLIPIFFFENIEEKDDFILEFFFRNSIFEDDILDIIEEETSKLKKSKISISEKVATILFDSEFLKPYFASEIDDNIVKYEEFGFERLRTYESLEKALNDDKNEKILDKIEEKNNEKIEEKNNEKNDDKILLILNGSKRKFLTELKLWKATNIKEYAMFRFCSYEALEDFYPIEIIEKHANSKEIERECEEMAENALDFFSVENFEKIKKIPLFERNLDLAKGVKLCEKLSGIFPETQLLKTESGKEILTNLLILFKEKSKFSKKASRSLEFLLAKVSFSMKSNYNNMKMVLDFLLKKDIEIVEFEACLSKFDVLAWSFYGIALPHLKMISVLNSEHSSIFLGKVPEFLMELIKPNKDVFKKNDVVSKVVNEVFLI